MPPTALWLRFDIPYAEDASVMRADLGFRDGDSVRSLPVEGQPDIPTTITTALDTAQSRKMEVSPDFTLVYPLDSRHAVAWAVKEEADKRSWQFSRHIPQTSLPDLDAHPRFAARTGSAEDDLPPDKAAELVVKLNAEAQEFFSTGMDLPDAMSALRHAMQAASARLGWNHPLMIYTLRNFGYVMRGTGNDDNAAEFLRLAGILVSEFTLSPPAPDLWDAETRTLIEQTAGLCATLGDENTGRALMEVKSKLG